MCKTIIVEQFNILKETKSGYKLVTHVTKNNFDIMHSLFSYLPLVWAIFFHNKRFIIQYTTCTQCKYSFLLNVVACIVFSATVSQLVNILNCIKLYKLI